MKVRLGVSLLTVAILAACSSTRDVADGNFDYLGLEKTPEISETEDLYLRRADYKYKVPELSENSPALLGKAVNIRPPLQVIAAAPGSRIEEGKSESIIYFDAVEGVTNLKQSIWEHTLRTLDELDAPYETDVNTGRIYLPRFEHLIRQERQGGISRLFNKKYTKTTSEQALEVQLNVASHGRSADLSIHVIEPTYFVNGVQQSLPMGFERRFEVDLINQISIAMERSFRTDRSLFVNQVVEVALGESGNGNPAYVLETDFQSIWVLLPNVFETLEFTIEDLNQAEGLYYTYYEPYGKKRWYHALAFWRKNKIGELGLANGTEVQFGVDEVEGVVYITPLINNEPISQEMLRDWHTFVQKAFAKE